MSYPYQTPIRIIQGIHMAILLCYPLSLRIAMSSVVEINAHYLRVQTLWQDTDIIKVQRQYNDI